MLAPYLICVQRLSQIDYHQLVLPAPFRTDDRNGLDVAP